MEKKFAGNTQNKNMSNENTNENAGKPENKNLHVENESKKNNSEDINTGIEEKFEKDKNYPVLADMDADKNPEDKNEKPSPDKNKPKLEKVPSH